jgi:TetR/AcrR family transcriptional repressor of nem operon
MARKKEFESEVVIEKAIEIFWQNGYKKTSMQALLDHLKIGRGSFYNAFESKHALFLLALDRYSVLMLAHLQGILLKKPLKGALAQLFQTLIDTILRDVDHRGCLMTNATTELASLDPDVAVRVNTYHQRCVRCFTEALMQARHAGEISEHHDPYALALFLMNTMDGLRVMAKRITERKTLEAIADTALTIVD